jgi:2-methylcitrate dehydratase PrpD
MSGQISKTPSLAALSGILSRPVIEQAQARARLHLLDWVGCAAAGAVEPAGKVLRSRSASLPTERAFVWGGLGNILEMDDVDKRALLHPGPSIIPAALAVARMVDADMPALLSAIVRGYDATIRLGRSVGTGHYALWHSTGTCGAIGAAAAAASLLSLEEDQTAHAMALAISQSSGLWHTRHDPASMGKQLHTAVAARAGCDAASLAQDGFRGPLTILEGPQGFFEAMCSGADPQDILLNPQSDWLIHEVSFKPWPACRHAHAVIDAALGLRSSTDLSDGRMFQVRTYGDALKFCDKPEPKSVIEAKFSLQHCVAVCLLRGEPTLEDFERAVINDPEITALRSRVRVSVGSKYEARYPARFGAELSDGTTVVQADDALGDPENPISELQIKQKAAMLLKAGGVPTDAAQHLIERVMTTENQTNHISDQIMELLS